MIKSTILIRLLSIGFLVVACQGGKPSQPTPVSSDFVVAWNELAYQVAYEHDQFYSLIGIRTLSMMHLAVHDALNVIEQRFVPYAYRANSEHANPVAAGVTAAYQVLVDAYPDRKDTLSSVYQTWLDQLENGDSKTSGMLLGTAAARHIIGMREGDGHRKQGNYTPMSKPGSYQYTPGWDNWVLKPDFSYAKPFALDTVTQFRSPEPPSLSSQTYAESYNEVKAMGQKNSRARSADQTAYAHWWAEFAEHSWNRIGRIVAGDYALDAWEANRMFALINVDIYDIYLASLESKYFYDTWRPYTAIRSTHDDGNPDTVPELDWQPEMLTPPWPEYPSAHAAVGAGGAEIVGRVLGTYDVHIKMASTSSLPDARDREFHNLRQAADECAESRIMNGYHFRFATEEGKRQGAQIASFIFDNYLQPRK